MKYLFFFMIFCSVLTTGCSDNTVEFSYDEKMLQDGWRIGEGGKCYYKYLTNEEVRVLVQKGVYSNNPNLRRTCNWTDGQYGSISCSGTCKVVWRTPRNTSIAASIAADVDMCISCSSGGSGACRPTM